MLNFASCKNIILLQVEGQLTVNGLTYYQVALHYYLRDTCTEINFNAELYVELCFLLKQHFASKRRLAYFQWFNILPSWITSLSSETFVQKLTLMQSCMLNFASCKNSILLLVEGQPTANGLTYYQVALHHYLQRHLYRN